MTRTWYSKRMIRLENVNKIYPDGTEALKEINLQVATGKIFGVIGPSGAGKSTLIRTVNGLESISSGVISVDNQNLTTLSPKQLLAMRRKIGMIFQHFNLLNSRTKQTFIS